MPDTTTRLITLIVLVLLLAACSSSPQVRFFTLKPMETAYTQDPDEALTMGLGPLRMPEYLNRSQIVTRGAGAEMLVDEFSRWAEPLNLSVHRVVSTDVDRLLDGVVVVAFPYEAVIRQQVNYRLVGEVHRFEADQSGRVVLETQWGIAEVGGEMAVAARRTTYKTQAGSANDSGAVAIAMNDALGQFSRDIAAALEAALPE